MKFTIKTLNLNGTNQTLRGLRCVRAVAVINRSEIRKHKAFWIVGRHQFMTAEEAFREASERFSRQISEASKKNEKFPHEALGVSKATLKKRMKLVEKYLTPPPSTSGDVPC